MQLTSFFALVVILEGSIQATSIAFKPLILGGEPTDIASRPWQVGILYKTSLFQFCGGSIITENYVLTAAHCVNPENPRRYIVMYGTKVAGRTDTDGVLTNVNRFYVHPKYNKAATFDYDTAILELETPIKFSPDAKAVSLSTVEPIVGEKAVVSGWGVTHANPQELRTRLLMKAVVDIVDKEKCAKSYMTLAGLPVTERMICAASEGKDACQGDSGGPITINDIQVGIVSWGIRCAEPDFPGVYTDIVQVREFIDYITNKTVQWTTREIDSSLTKVTKYQIDRYKYRLEDEPWQVALLTGSKIRLLCGGSIIEKHFVMTTANCVEDSSKRYTVMYGSIGAGYLSQDGVEAIVSRVHIHPKHKPSDEDYDIAILELEAPIRYSVYAKAIPLSRTEPRIGKNALITGWGTYNNHYSSIKGSKYLQETSVEIISRDLCNNIYEGDSMNVTKRMFCATVKVGKDFCQTDRGGAISMGGVQMGIVSWGAVCADTFYPQVYTNLADPEIGSFIDEVTKKTLQWAEKATKRRRN